MTAAPGPRLGLAVAGLLGLGAGVRALRFAAPFATPWHWDETSFGVQAVQLLGGDFPVNFLGVEYMGAAPAYPLAVWFAVVGPSPAALDLFAYAAGLAVLGTGYLVARRTLDRPAALVALTLLAVPPLLLARRSLDGSLSYQLLFVLGHLFLLGTHSFFFRSPGRPAALLGLGLLAGVGLWANPLMVVYLAGFGVLAVRTGLLWQPRAALFVAGVALGSLPAWCYDLAHYPSARLDIHAAGWSGALPLVQQAGVVAGRFLPIVLGARDTAGHPPPPLEALGLGLVGIAALVRAVCRDRAALAWAVGAARRPPPEAPAVLLWALVAANLGLVLLTPRGAGGDRYLLPLYSVLPVWLGEGLAWLGRRWRPAAALAIAALLAFHLWSNWSDSLGSTPASKRRWRALDVYLRPLTAWLEPRGIDRVYWGYAPALTPYELTFLTGRRVVAAELWREPVLAHADLVDAAASPPIVFTPDVEDGARVLESLRETLRGVGMEVREARVGPWLVLQPERAVAPGFVPLPADRWTVSASPNAEQARRLVDRDASTGWTTAAPQAPGQWIAVDLGADETVARVDLLAIDWQEVPAGLRVEVSADGAIWRPVVSVPHYWGPLFLAETHSFLKVRRGRVQAVFPPIRARWLRLVQTGDVPGREWRARELMVYEPGGRPAAPPAIDELTAALRRGGVGVVHTNPWLAARLRTETRGAVRTDEWNFFTNPYGRTLPDPSALPRLTVDSDRAVVVGGGADLAGIRALLAGQGVAVREERRDAYRLLRFGGRPAEPRRVSKDGWGATAAEHAEAAWQAIDGNRRTAWESEGSASFVLDLARPRQVGRLRVVPGLRGARRAELRLEGSVDAVGWRRLGPVAWAGPLYWTGWEVLRDGSDGWDLRVPPARVRYVRLTPTAEPPGGRWSIGEIEVFE